MDVCFTQLVTLYVELLNSNLKGIINSQIRNTKPEKKCSFYYNVNYLTSSLNNFVQLKITAIFSCLSNFQKNVIHFKK